jgi:hypothetical protein
MKKNTELSCGELPQRLKPSIARVTSVTSYDKSPKQSLCGCQPDTVHRHRPEDRTGQLFRPDQFGERLKLTVTRHPYPFTTAGARRNHAFFNFLDLFVSFSGADLVCIFGSLIEYFELHLLHKLVTAKI